MAKKLTLGIISFLFLLAMVVLYIRGTSYTEGSGGSTTTFELSDQELAIRFIGNDYAIRNITIPMDSTLSAGNSLEVYFVKGDTDLEKAEILRTDVYTAEEINAKDSLSLSYPREVLTYSRDYFIVLRLSDKSTGSISFAADQDDDCRDIYVDNEVTKMSIRYEVEYYRHSTSKLFFLETILMLLLFALVIMVLFDVFFWRALEISTIFILAFVYLFGLLDRINLMVVFVCGLLLCGVVMVVVQGIRGKLDFSKIRSQDTVVQVAIWIVLLGIIFVRDGGAYVIPGDECSQWATAVNNLYVWDKMYIHSDSTIIGFRNPPLIALFQYFFTKVAGYYEASILHFSKHLMEINISLGLLTAISAKRKRIYYVVTSFLALVLPMLFFQLYDIWYNALSIDIPFGIIYASFCVESAILLKDKCILQKVLVFLSGIELLMAKDNGLLLMAVAIGTVIVFWLLFERNWKKGKDYAQIIIISLLSFLVARVSWDTFVRVKSSNISFSSAMQVDAKAVARLSLQSVWAYISGNGEPYQYSIIPAHILKLLGKEDYPLNLFNASYVGVLLIILLVVGLAHYSLNYQREKSENDTLFKKALTIAVTGGFLCAAAYHVVYTFSFSEAEAVIFASEPRYLGSFLLALVFLELYILQLRLDEEENEPAIQRFLMLLALFFFVLTGGCKQFMTNLYNRPAPDSYLQAIMNFRYEFKETDNVYMIGTNMGHYLGCLYYNTPVHISSYLHTDADGNNLFSYMPSVLEDSSHYGRSLQELEEELRDYTYLYIDNYEDAFVECYGSIFEDLNDIKVGGLYRVEKTNSGVQLRLWTEHVIR